MKNLSIYLAGIGLCLLLVATSTSASHLFEPAVLYDVGNGPTAIFSADFDGDGDNDLAVVNSDDDNLTILLNNGNGTFFQPPYSPIDGLGDQPVYIHGADFDGVNGIDLVVANVGPAPGHVTILLNDGTGNFTTIYDVDVSGRNDCVFSSDLDNDGDFDLLVARFVGVGGGDVMILQNDGFGNFVDAGNYTVNAARFVISADLDNDDFSDLIALDQGADQVRVYWNSGNLLMPEFDPTPTVVSVGDPLTSHVPVSVFAADFDGDNDIDLAVANAGAARNVSILLNNGNRTFQDAVHYSSGNPPGAKVNSVFTIDLNGDNNNDLVALNGEINRVSIFFNDGSGQFVFNDIYVVGDNPQSVFSVDLDGDNDNDLAFPNFGSDNVSILINTTNQPTFFPEPFEWALVSSGSPTARYGHDMVYDATYNITIMFGGQTGSGLSDETFAWGGTSWIPLGTTQAPSARVGHTMAYNTVISRVYLFGGYDGTNVNNELWQFDYATGLPYTWTQVSVIGDIPSTRTNAVMVFDVAAGRLVLFGGNDQTERLGDTYEFDYTINSWSQISPGGGLDEPNPRELHDMVYWPAGNSTILYGGVSSGAGADETWQYSTFTNNWVQLNPDNNPGVRAGHKMVSSPITGNILLYGNAEDNITLWEFDGGIWEEISVLGLPNPGARSRHAMAWDTRLREMVLYGGKWGPPTIPDDETWVYPNNSASRAYKLVGVSDGDGWSFSITDDLVPPAYNVFKLDVDGISAGSPASDIVQHFVDEINALNSTGLIATAFGDIFMITVSGLTQPLLCVGDFNQQPTCCVPTSTSCQFNPDIFEFILAGRD